MDIDKRDLFYAVSLYVSYDGPGNVDNILLGYLLDNDNK